MGEMRVWRDTQMEKTFHFHLSLSRDLESLEGGKTHRCKHGGRVIQAYGRHMCPCRIQIHEGHLIRVGWELQHASLMSSHGGRAK